MRKKESKLRKDETAPRKERSSEIDGKESEFGAEPGFPDPLFAAKEDPAARRHLLKQRGPLRPSGQQQSPDARRRFFLDQGRLSLPAVHSVSSFACCIHFSFSFSGLIPA